MYVFIEMLEQDSPRVLDTSLNRFVHLRLELPERFCNFFGGPAALVDRENALFEIDTGFNRTKHIVRCSKHSIEQAELVTQ